MNNHWGTNYRAYQAGPVTFRYAMRLHRGTDKAEAHRFAVGLSQPLLAARSTGEDALRSLLLVEHADVVVQGLKPSVDGKAWIVRLFGASGTACQATLAWPGKQAGTAWLSNLAEKQIQPADKQITVGGCELVILRVERA